MSWAFLERSDQGAEGEISPWEWGEAYRTLLGSQELIGPGGQLFIEWRLRLLAVIDPQIVTGAVVYALEPQPGDRGGRADQWTSRGWVWTSRRLEPIVQARPGSECWCPFSINPDQVLVWAKLLGKRRHAFSPQQVDLHPVSRRVQDLATNCLFKFSSRPGEFGTLFLGLRSSITVTTSRDSRSTTFRNVSWISSLVVKYTRSSILT